MQSKIRIINFIYLLSIIILLNSCLFHNVVITRDYVTNSDWGSNDSYFGKAEISIKKIILTDSLHVDNILIEDIIKDYIIDSAFCYSTMYTDNTKIKKIYFNKYHKDIIWMKGCSHDLNGRAKTIGRLELNTWYQLDEIRPKYRYYVFIDSEGKAHVFSSIFRVDNF